MAMYSMYSIQLPAFWVFLPDAPTSSTPEAYVSLCHLGVILQLALTQTS